MTRARTVTLQNLLDAFQVFDKDNNGRISCAEFRHLMSNCGARDLSEDEADAIFMVILHHIRHTRLIMVLRMLSAISGPHRIDFASAPESASEPCRAGA